MKIIYKNINGGVSVIYPTDESLTVMTIGDIAKKDVPTGIAYAIVEDDFIPTDRTYRDAWVVDESILVDGIGE